MADRFDLENDITNLLGLSDDLEMLSAALLDDIVSTDDVVNALTGMAVMARLRAGRTFDTFKAVFELDEYRAGRRDSDDDDTISKKYV
jgi:hypothetical protein